jgi:hypothetical protein
MSILFRVKALLHQGHQSIEIELVLIQDRDSDRGGRTEAAVPPVDRIDTTEGTALKEGIDPPERADAATVRRDHKSWCSLHGHEC